MLILRYPKLTQAQKNQKWFTVLSKAGVTRLFAPVKPAEFPRWLRTRVEKRGMQVTAEAIQLLTHFLEGNLAQAAQEIEKLYLIYGTDTPLSAAAIQEAVNHHAQFDIFKFIDAALSGDADKTTTMLTSLRRNQVEPTAIVWILSREIRTVLNIHTALAAGDNWAQIFNRENIWTNRQQLFKQTIKRCSAEHLVATLQHAAQIDRMIKGVETGDVWQHLWICAMGLIKPADITRLRTPIHGSL